MVSGTGIASWAATSILGDRPLAEKLGDVDAQHRRHFEQIDFLGIGELSEWLPVDVGRVVLPRVDLKVPRELFLLFFARKPRLRDDPLAGVDGQGVAEEDGGVREGLPSEPWQGGFAVPDGILGHVDDDHVRCAIEEQPIPVGTDVGCGLVEGVVVEGKVRDHPQRGLTCLMRYPAA